MASKKQVFIVKIFLKENLKICSQVHKFGQTLRNSSLILEPVTLKQTSLHIIISQIVQISIEISFFGMERKLNLSLECNFRELLNFHRKLLIFFNKCYKVKIYFYTLKWVDKTFSLLIFLTALKSEILTTKIKVKNISRLKHFVYCSSND